MTLIDRYLRAVKDNLPRSQQDDIIGELSANLHAEIEDEEAARGRPLLDEEQAMILKRYGNPLVVAARYRGDDRSVTFGRKLIGPELFPTFAKVLAINVAITALISLIAFLVGGSIWSAIYGGLVPIVLQFVIVTAIFIVMDRRFVSDPDRWDPHTVGATEGDLDNGSLDGLARQLIGKPEPKVVSYATSLLEFAIMAIGLTIWLSIGVPDPGLFMKPGPGWANLFVPVAVVVGLGMLIPIVTLFRPSWTRFHLVAWAIYDTATLVYLAVSLALGDWLVLSDPATAAANEPGLVAGINTIIRISIAVAIVVTALSLAFRLRRLRRMQTVTDA